MRKIIILGAGGTGLATGLALADLGWEVEIYDAASVPGGLAGSEEIDGMYFDYGPHIYHTHDSDINDYWQEKFSDLLTSKEFFSLNYKEGKYYEYPLSYEVIEHFPKETRDKILYELDNRKSENFKRATNFKECLVALVGPTLEEIFFDDYSRKLWGLPTEEMAASWAPKRIEIRKKNKSFWYNQFGYVPTYGSGRIMQRMVDQIVKKGNTVNLQHKISNLNLKNYKVNRIDFENGKSINVGNSIVISTIPIVALANILKIKNDLKFTKYIMVYLMFEEKSIFPPNVQTVYYADEKYYFHRVTEQKKYSDFGYPENKTIMCFEISVNEKTHILEMPENDLIQTVLDQFCEIGLTKKEKFIKGFTRTLPHVNPIMKTGYEEELASVRSQISIINNIHTVGGSAEFQYGDLQVMFAKAKDAVDLLTSEHYVINKNVKSGLQFSFNDEVKIYNFSVGKENPAMIIAELGINHNGDIEIGKELIREAKKSGVNLVKLQTYSESSRVSKTAKGAKYVDRTLDMEETTWEMFKRLRLSKEDHITLFNYANELNIPITSTPFDEASVDLLIELGVKAFKIASFDIVNIPFLRYVASKKLPIMLSTGMSSMAIIEEALDAIAEEENPNVVLLHCVSSYPTSPLDVNLKAIETMKTAFKVPVGFSDHTVGNLVPNIAISIGAHLIEKHFTLDRRLEGTDHILSLDPDGMTQLVDERNTIYSALGTGIKRPAASEYVQINTQRKSIFSNADIKKGEKLTLENITIKGPGHGLLPKYLQIILGKTVSKDVAEDSPITWDDILTN